jgi:hypothetical protein
MKLMPWWATQLNGRHLYPGHAAYRIHWPDQWPPGEISNQIRANRDRRFDNVLGSVFFRAKYGITDNPGGFRDSLRTDLYKERALIPRMSWKDQVPPLAAGNARYERIEGEPAKLRWDVPGPAGDGDSASMYAVYRFETDPGVSPNIDDPAAIFTVTNAQTFDAPVPSLDSGSYFFAITSLDRNHNESSASNVITVVSPSAPYALLPASGTTDLADTISFAWNRTDATSRYTLDISSDTSFQSPHFMTLAVKDTFATAFGFDGQTRYAWRVRAGNAGGSSDYAGASYFTTGFPATPELSFPADFTTNAPQHLTLRWQPSLSAQSYQLQFSTTSSFGITIIDTIVAADTTFTISGLEGEKIYFWRVRASNSLGFSRWSQTWKFRTQIATSVTAELNTPKDFQLFQNYPNPFNPSTIIRFSIPVSSTVDLFIFDILGRRIRSLVNASSYSAGTHSVMWNGTDDDGEYMSNGVYIYRLHTNEYTRSKRMILLR